MKKVLSALLALCLLIGALALPASAAVPTPRSGKCGDIDYSLDSKGTLTLSGSGTLKAVVSTYSGGLDSTHYPWQVGYAQMSESYEDNEMINEGFADEIKCFVIEKNVKPDPSIRYHSVFDQCENLTDIYYAGTETEWKSAGFSDSYSGVTIHYNSKGSGGDKPMVSSFSDVKESDYFAVAVVWAIDKGITSGTGDGKFSPGAACTREQIVTFLWRAAGSPEPVTTTNPFRDVKTSDYSYKAILWAVENEVTSGTGKGEFSPKSPCKRGEVMTFMWKASGQPQSSGSSFTDVPAGAFYEKPVAWAVASGITSGTGGNKFSPNSTCTRGQIVTFLYRNRDDK